MSKRKEPVCRRCGVEMTWRENYTGCGYCFVCAPIYSPSRQKVDDSRFPDEQ